MKYFNDCHTFAELKARFRELAAIHHPDKGGDSEVFNQICNEHEVIFRRWQRPLRCSVCNGDGMQTVWEGFRPAKVQCPKCQGEGLVQR